MSHQLIDCNVVIEKPLAELAEMVRRRQVRYHRDLPAEIFARLKAAIGASPVVEGEINELL